MSPFKKYFFALAVFFFSGEILMSAQNLEADSLSKLLKKEKTDTGKVKILNTLFSHYEFSDVEKASKYLDEALALSLKINYRKGLAQTYTHFGFMAEDTGNIMQALIHYTQALKIMEELNDKYGMSSAYNNIGIINRNQGNYPEALKNHLSALKMREETGDKKGQGFSHNNIGEVYRHLRNYSEALKSHSAALKIEKELLEKAVAKKDERAKRKIKITIADSYNNIGNIYAEQNIYDEAMKNYFASLKINEEMADTESIARTYGNIGIIYDRQGNYTEAEKNYFASLNMSEKTGNLQGSCGTYINIGTLYLQQKNYKESEKFLLKALKLTKETGDKELIKESYVHLAALDSATGNYKNSYENFKLFVIYRDSLTNEENTKKLVQSQMQYDFDKISAADSIKNSEAKKFEEVKHQQEISRQKTFTYGGIAGFLVMIVVAGISFRAFKNKQKANIEIQHQKELVEEKQKEILDSIRYAKRIQTALITSEKYFIKNLGRLNTDK